MARDRLGRVGAGGEVALAVGVAFAVAFGTGLADTARWLTYASFLYIPVVMAGLRGIDFAEYGLFLRNPKRTIGTALVSGGIILGLFTLGYWLVVDHAPVPIPWAPGFDAPWRAVFEFTVTQFLVVAISEEYFYRGYLQKRFDALWRTRWRILGADLGPGWIASAALFAVGHLGEGLHPARLLTFFPGLWFGWCRARSGDVYAAVAVHAASNLLIAYLQGQNIAG